MRASTPGRSGRRAAWLFGAGISLILIVTIFGIEASLRRQVKVDRASSDGIGNAPGERTASFPREIVDAMGEKLSIPSPPQRIVSQTLATDEILLSICSPERIVAVSALACDPYYSNVADDVRALSLTQVEGVEQILRLDPDLIFVASYSRAEFVDLLNAAGAPVFRFAGFNRIDDIKTNIRIVGAAVGEEERAEDQIRRMELRIDEAKSGIPPDAAPPRLMSYTAPGFTAGADTLFDEVARMAGAVNVAAEEGVVGIQKIDAEQITAWEPDFLIAGAGVGTRALVREQLLTNPAIAASKAGRNGRVIIMDNRHFMAVSHHVASAVEVLVHELFGTKSAVTR